MSDPVTEAYGARVRKIVDRHLALIAIATCGTNYYLHKAASMGSMTDRPTYHYGPTKDDPDPGKMWCYGCGCEIFVFREGMGCTECGWFTDGETGETEWDTSPKEFR